MVKITELTTSVVLTDWGQVAAVWSDRGLWEMSFPRALVEQALAELHSVQPDNIAGDFRDEQLRQELQVYFRGYNLPFTVPVDWRGYTRFQEAVLRYSATIPYGQTESYGAVARAVGSPRAARAVGGAMHSNRTPIVVPCHRVVGSDGSLTGFGGGLELKQALLLLEGEKNIASKLSNRI